jgi:GTP-binding protein
VALAGRPNAGKSTLFNRLARKRRAITSPVAGVTRDAVETAIVLDGRPLRLIDTGGFKLAREEERGALSRARGEIDGLVVRKTLETIRGADLVVLLIAAGDISAEDEEFVSLLRPLGKRLLVCVNKIEGGRLCAEASNLFAWGFERLFFISAEHGDNVAELSAAILERLDALGAWEGGAAADDLEERPIRLALIGKPNTGKSTLSNRLTASASSLVSGEPGTTRDVIEGEFRYKNRRFITLDTAGLRRASRIDDSIEYYASRRAQDALGEADVVFLLIDAVEGFSEQDKKIAALAAERGRGIIFALNKWDLMPAVKNTFNAVRDRIHFLFPRMAYAPLLPISAASGEGVEKLLDSAVTLFSQLNRRIETAAFNALLQRWQEEYPPPSGPATRFKIKYGLQTGENPLIFKVFVSRPQAWTESYHSYICNRLRRDAGFSMAPVRLEIAPSREGRRGCGRRKRARTER